MSWAAKDAWSPVFFVVYDPDFVNTWIPIDGLIGFLYYLEYSRVLGDSLCPILFRLLMDLVFSAGCIDHGKK